ncbi:hypothetical protein [Sorangium sp. So ce117]|uniref:hypothetical protein n=1 Tax=Sorangium sp. So ce117 TaxID=3133277 RepID=UPI003F5DCFA5
MNELLSFLQRLHAGHLSYTLAHNRDESIMVLVAVPGERWEVEFFSDGSVEVEVFTSNGKILAGDALAGLFARHSSAEHE